MWSISLKKILNIILKKENQARNSFENQFKIFGV
jgi:hypothetical protein